MPSVQQFQIVLDTPNGVYFAGQNVSGRVELHLSQQMNIGGVSIHIKSRAKVRWREGGSKGATYFAREKYMDSYVTLCCVEKCAPGTYNFPFSFLLPHDLPTTFVGRYGNVKHSVKAILDSRIVFKHKAKAALTLLPSINVQDMPACREPVRVVVVKKPHALFGSAGTITAVLSLSFTGFVPGQQVPFSIDIDNDSDINISDVVCTLEKRVICFTIKRRKKSPEEQNKLAMVSLGAVEPKTYPRWSSTLTVPNVLPEFLASCSIIDMVYIMKVKVKLSGLHRNMKLYVPVMLGIDLPSSECPPPPFEDCFVTSAVDHQNEDSLLQEVHNIRKDIKTTR